MNGKYEKKRVCLGFVSFVLIVCFALFAVYQYSMVHATRSDFKSIMTKFVGAPSTTTKTTIIYKRLREDGFLEPKSIVLESLITVPGQGRKLHVSVPFEEPTPREDDDADLRFYTKVSSNMLDRSVGADIVSQQTLPTPIYKRKDFQRRSLLSYAPRDTHTPFAKPDSNGTHRTKNEGIVTTVIVGVFSAIIGCGVVLSALSIKRCILLSLSEQDWSASADETSTRLSRFLRKPPVPVKGKETTSSILDMSLYGTSKGESVSPISSAVMMSSSMEDEDEDPELGPERCAKDILRPSDANKKVGYVFVLRSNKTESTASDSSPTSTETESRDDVESAPGFMHDIFIVRPENSTDLGLILNDAIYPGSHPSVAFIDGSSVLAGRISAGDFIVAVNNSDVVGKTAENVLLMIERSLQNEIDSIKLTVMSSMVGKEESPDSIGTLGSLVSIEI